MYDGSLTVAGEFMGTRRFAMHAEPEFLSLIDLMRAADTAYCHFEMNLLEPGSGYPGRAYALSALRAEPGVAKDLKWAGVDLASCAYNHALDWGLPGVVQTRRHLTDAGIINAGTGENLEEAAEPAYLETPAGRVALISAASGQHPYDAASASNPPVPGRPGVNPLRFTQKFELDEHTLTVMREAWSSLGMSLEPRYFMSLEEGDVCFNLGDHGGGDSYSFIGRVGPEPRIVSTPDEADLQRLLRSVSDAKRQADLVLVAHHAAINDGHRGEDPASLVPPVARACIDAGADVFIGHGWHRQLGLEIYEGAPIFYGTGNFFAQSAFLTRFPADTFEGHGVDLANLPDLTSADLHDVRARNLGHHHLAQPWGAIAKLTFTQGAATGIEFHPYTLGHDADPARARSTGTRMDGRPLRASGDDASEVIDYIADLSAKFGTDVTQRDGVGHVAL